MRVLGLDVGDRRIGVAVSDPDGIMAWGIEVVQRRGKRAAVAEILRLAKEREVGLIVVGLPLSMDGSIGAQAQKVLDFCRALSQRAPVPVETWDERLSSVAAERLMAEAGASRAARKANSDMVAAAIILQGYLDRARRP